MYIITSIAQKKRNMMNQAHLSTIDATFRFWMRLRIEKSSSSETELKRNAQF